MPLPDISGYLAATRQPLDLVGPAIAAFQTVSSEMRATRAQNQSEEESARDLGKGIKEGMQKDRMFEEKILDMRHQQGIEDQSLAQDLMRIQMDQQMQQFKMEQEFPLEVQYRQAQMAMMSQESRLKAEKLQMDQQMMGLGNANLDLIDSVFSGRAEVPQAAIAEGEDAASPKARVRWAHNALEQLDKGVGSLSGNPYLKMQIAMRRQMLAAEPTFQEMEESDDLILPSKKQARRSDRERNFWATIPGDDSWTQQWMQANQRSIGAMLDASDSDYPTIANVLRSRAEKEHNAYIDSIGGLPPDKVEIRSQNKMLNDHYLEVLSIKAQIEHAEKSGDPLLKPMLPELRGKLIGAEAQLGFLQERFGASLMPGTPGATGFPTTIDQSHPGDRYYPGTSR